MSLKHIEHGSLASSSDLNSNFQYLESEIDDLSEQITTQTANFASTVSTLNTSVNDVLECRESFIQTGMILPSLAPTVPKGFLLCDGSEVNVTDYPELFEVIGTIFGSSDSTKFKLPDLRDKTLWGIGSSTLGTLLTSKLPNITGRFRLTGTGGNASTEGAFYASGRGGVYSDGHDQNNTNPNIYLDASKSSDVYSDDTTIVQPPALVVNFLIKY